MGAAVMAVCVKVRYASVRAVRRAHRRLGCRLRPYYCGECNAWHASNGEKR